MIPKRMILFTGLVVVAAGCDRAASPTVAPESGGTAPAATTASDEAAVREMLKSTARPQTPDTSGLPPGHPPLNAAPQAGPALPPPSAAATPIVFEAPTDWKSEPPASSMRTAQYRIDPVEGDESPAEVVVYAGIGGSPIQNIERWRAQFSTPEGGPIPDSDYRLESFDVGGMKVTMVEISGVYTNTMAPSAAGRESQHNSRLLGAVIEAPGGLWFIKATGPDATMKAQRAAISQFILSARPAE